VNPVLRDTITVLEGSYIVLRFADRNPGLWMMHCHIDWHMAAGLAMVLYERDTSSSASSSSQSAGATSTLSSAAIGGIIAGGLVFGLGFAGSIFFYYTFVHNWEYLLLLHPRPLTKERRQEEETTTTGSVAREVSSVESNIEIDVDIEKQPHGHNHHFLEDEFWALSSSSE
jgi:hypothetical protein